MNMSNADVAQVLEDAADLYQSEQVEWCSGAWVRFNKDTGVLSACAEGALFLARGYDRATVREELDNLFRKDPLAKAARDALLATIKQDYPGETQVHLWNDNRIGGRQPVQVAWDRRDGTRNMLTEPIPAVAKAEVVEAMRRTAKDLCNN